MTIRWEPLGGVDIATTEDYGFSADALLLAEFASPKPGERVVDLGTGCGILPLLFLRDPAVPFVAGVEIQPAAAELLRLSLERNGLTERAAAVCAAWETAELPRESFRLAVCNPPYFPPGSGKASASDAARLARHEGPDTLRHAVEAAARLLQYGGRFCLCHRPERLADVLVELRRAGLEPKRLRPVEQRGGQAPWLLLVEAKKGGRPGVRWESAKRMDRDGFL